MKFKTVFCLILVVALFQSAYGSAKFRKGSKIITGQVMSIHHATGLGINFELGIARHISLGGDACIFWEGDGVLMISPDIAYHFDVKVRDLDVMAGLGPSMYIGLGGGSDFRFKIFGGARYYFSPRWAGYFKLHLDFGGEGSVGGAFGLSYRLK